MKKLTIFTLILIFVAAFSAAQSPAAGTFRQEGIASWYGDEFAGKPTASGEIFDPAVLTAAHPTLPFGTIVIVTNTQNMRQVPVRINDRGPFVAARIIDVSRAAAEVLDMVSTGTAPVIIEAANNFVTAPQAAMPAPPPAQFHVPAPVPQTAMQVPPPAQFHAPAPVPQAVMPVMPPPAQFHTPAPVPQTAMQVPPPAQFHAPVPVPQAVMPVMPAPQAFFPAPPAVIRGTIPPANSTGLFRLQVASFSVPRNAVDAFERLKNAGLNPAYERNGDFYRVVLPGVRAADLPAIAQTLGNAGFREAIIREESR